LSAKSILFLGFGDLAARACALLPSEHCVGVARSPKSVPPGVEFWQGAADSLTILAKLAETPFDAAVISLTPTEFSDRAYALAYVDTVTNLLRQWQQGAAPKRIFFVSSTSVYHQDQGEWVDELSPVAPTGFAGRRLLEAEQCLVSSGLPVCILRLAGIYGPGRDFLLRQVRAGIGGNSDFTNRIHAHDCAAAIAHLLQRDAQGLPLDALYLGCDSLPAVSREVRAWLAVRLGLDPQALVAGEGQSSRGGNKRCSNQRLLSTGFTLRYPSYREGYETLLNPQVDPLSLP
jgi:nucleoside-diphosphate-sugar epimerase